MSDKYELIRVTQSERSGHIRDIPVVGVMPMGLPKVGESITLLCDPVVEGATGRLVQTSTIVAYDGDSEYVTESGSVYQLKIRR